MNMRSKVEWEWGQERRMLRAVLGSHEGCRDDESEKRQRGLVMKPIYSKCSTRHR